MDENEVTISPLPNGPYLVKGPARILDSRGNDIATGRATVALCRCGGSTTKPFCDGTHSRIGFQAAEEAVEEEEQAQR